MKIFITGGSGFVGGHLIKWFVERGHIVYAMSRSVAADEKIKSKGGIAVRCDLASIQSYDLKGMEVVIHAAAMLGQWQPKQKYYEVNVAGTTHLLDTAKSAGVNTFLFISTESVLFAGKHLININERTPYPENSPFFYANTKQEAEKKVIQANIPGSFKTIAIRPRLIWGPDEPHFIPKLISGIKTGKFLWIDHGKCRTSTTHIYNLCNACEQVIVKEMEAPVLFITDGETVTFKDFFSSLINAHGITKIPNRTIPGNIARLMATLFENLWRLAGITSHPPITRSAAATFSTDCIIDDSLARETLGIKPVISMQQGIEEIRNNSG
jgi:nucleoside-diphosphate-sugar epimerase